MSAIEQFSEELFILKELSALKQGEQIEYYDDRTNTWKQAFFSSLTALGGPFTQRMILMESLVDSVNLAGSVKHIRERIRLEQDVLQFLF